MIKPAVVLFMCLLGAGPTHADSTIGDLLTHCEVYELSARQMDDKTDIRDVDAAFCAGFIEGFSQLGFGEVRNEEGRPEKLVQTHALDHTGGSERLTESGVKRGGPSGFPENVRILGWKKCMRGFSPKKECGTYPQARQRALDMPSGSRDLKVG